MTLYCDKCHKEIEELTPEEADADLPGHGWSDFNTAHSTKCYDCADRYDEYETYYAGRLKKRYPGKVFMMMPDLDHPDKEIECYSESLTKLRKKVK